MIVTGATDQPRIQVPKLQRERLQKIVHEAYPFAFTFYYHAALHYIIFAKCTWTEFLMRQACLVLEQFFLTHAGSPVYIVNFKDALFAEGILRDEVRKTQSSYSLKMSKYNN
ncbi:hypothetical protein FRC07_008138 [Ceratobasidium sp. 392]|nr:hypothetical protein FRC07_008138 [Ceratobasidium sp. 392]